MATMTVYQRLKKANVVLRDRKTATKLRVNKHFSWTKDLHALVDGLLLGDGGLERSKEGGEARLYLRQSMIHYPWVDQTKAALEEVKVTGNISIAPCTGRWLNDQWIKGEDTYTLKTKRYVQFTKEWRRWYRENARNGDDLKIIPKNVRLTPISLAYWFCGDGVKGNNSLSFCTNGFTWDEVDFLRFRLNAIYGWKCGVTRHTNNRPMMSICTGAHYREFLALVEPFVPSCFRYKMYYLDLARGIDPVSYEHCKAETLATRPIRKG